MSSKETSFLCVQITKSTVNDFDILKATKYHTLQNKQNIVVHFQVLWRYCEEKYIKEIIFGVSKAADIQDTS